MKEINQRRSIRKYLDKAVEKEKVELLLRAAMQAPSACNQQPWEFIIVDDKALLKELSTVHQYAKMVEFAPLAIIALGNKETMRCPDYWQQDLAAATQNILIEAVHIGLGGVWLGVAPNEERMSFIRKMLDLDDHYLPFNVIPIGYPNEIKVDDNRYSEDKIRHNKE